jgi:hypothetical protein
MVPASLGDFYVVDMECRYPIDILALPALLTRILNVDNF